LECNLESYLTTSEKVKDIKKTIAQLESSLQITINAEGKLSWESYL